jgi:Flavin containing amine oxidoreductase
VLVTAPLGVLKKGSITFSPPLPARKQEAIERLGFGLLNKVHRLHTEPQRCWRPCASDPKGSTRPSVMRLPGSISC